jgi:hypothetical protein
MNLKKIGTVFTSISFGTGPLSYEKKNLPGRGLTNVEKHWSRRSRLANFSPSYSTEVKNTCSFISNAQRKAVHTSKWFKDLNSLSRIKLTPPPTISKIILYTCLFSNHTD